jgi:hypothetical protein
VYKAVRSKITAFWLPRRAGFYKGTNVSGERGNLLTLCSGRRKPRGKARCFMGRSLPTAQSQPRFLSFYPHICAIVFLRGLLTLRVVQLKTKTFHSCISAYRPVRRKVLLCSILSQRGTKRFRADDIISSQWPLRSNQFRVTTPLYVSM